MKKNQFLVLYLTFFVILNNFAQDLPNTNSDYVNQLNTISTSVPFLIIAPDSRSGAMGDVGVATNPDHNSLHWNASKFAFIEESNGFSLSYTPWLQDLVPEISLSYLSGFKRLNSRNTLAASLRYFSLGEIQFTDNTGQEISKFNPNEFAIDGAYAMKLSDNFSMGLAMRYIYSNLTGGISTPGGGVTKPGKSFATDLSGYFRTKDFNLSEKDANLALGFNVSNIGNKITYTDGGEEHFLPMNLRIGSNLNVELDDYNSLSIAFDINKLLVPTPPVYDSIGTNPENIVAGKNPNVSVLQGIFQSFNDAPGGLREELNELMYSIGAEYWYQNQFAFRGGYFHEHQNKGARKYFTLGAGLRMNVFSLDMAFLLPATRGVRSPLANTLRFTMLFDMETLYGTDKL